MRSLFRSAVSDQSSENQLNLVGNLNPIVHSLRIFGIDLAAVQSNRKYRRCGSILFGAITIVTIATSTYLRLCESKKSLSLTSTMSWSRVLVRCVMVARNVLLTLALLQMATLLHWRPLWRNMQDMEKHISYPATFHSALSKVSLASIIFIFFLVVNQIPNDMSKFNSQIPNQEGDYIHHWLMDYWLVMFQELSTTMTKGSGFKIVGIQSLIQIGILMTDLYEDLTIALFFSLTYIASMSLQLIIDDVRVCSIVPHSTPAHQIMQWKTSYCLVLNFTRRVNQFLEATLFLFIAKQFTMCSLMFVSAVCLWAKDARGMSDAFVTAYLLKNTVLISVITFGSQNMKHKSKVLQVELFTQRCTSTNQSEVSYIKSIQFVENIGGIW